MFSAIYSYGNCITSNNKNLENPELSTVAIQVWRLKRLASHIATYMATSSVTRTSNMMLSE